MSIPREFINLVLAKIDLVDLVSQQIPLQKKSGSNYFFRCPFHQEKSASFSVSQPKQFYHCFGCGAHGNAIDFLMEHDRLTFPETIETLARSVGMEVPNPVFTASNKQHEELPDLYELMTAITAYYYEQMRGSTRAIDYLKKRGISGVIAQQFSLGYAPNSFHQLLDTFGKTEADKKKLLDVGCIIKKTDSPEFYDRFRDRIIFPIHNYRGHIIGFGGRIIDQGEPKYLNSPDTILFQKGHELYGLYQALKTNRNLERILIVEGYMDVIALFQQGITYAVATLGTATTSQHLNRLFRYTAELIFCFDGDMAGKGAAWRALLTLFPLMHDSLQVRFLFLPDGEDPDSLVRKEGKTAFENRITSAHSLSQFFLQHISEQSDMSTMEGRARFATTGLAHIKQLPSGIYQTILLEALAKQARIEKNILLQQFEHGNEEGESTGGSSSSSKIKLSQPIRLAMALLIQYPHLAKLIIEPLPKLSITGYVFLIELIQLLHETANITTGLILEHFRGQKAEAFIAKLAHWDHLIPETGVKSEFLGIIRQLTLQGLDEEIECLLAKASLSLTATEKVELAALIAKKKHLAAAPIS